MKRQKMQQQMKIFKLENKSIKIMLTLKGNRESANSINRRIRRLE